MSQGNLKVGYEALDQSAANILTAAADLDDRLDQLERYLGDKMQYWSGDDQAAYLQAQTEWNTAMAEMNNILREVANQVNLSKEEYMAAEKGNARRFYS